MQKNKGCLGDIYQIARMVQIIQSSKDDMDSAAEAE
jgi:hypothetical protein